jgi:uncharacterized membrane protein YhaH (DUF805 family)
MNWGHLLFGFSGRINRAKIWLWILIWIIAWVVGMIAAFAIVYATGLVAVFFLIYAVIGIAGFISYLAAVIKRLHDRDKSGWWLLVFVLLPSVLVGISSAMTMSAIISGGGDLSDISVSASPVGTVVYLIGAAIGLWAFVELFCLRGTIGANKYGPDPLGGPA